MDRSPNLITPIIADAVAGKTSSPTYALIFITEPTKLTKPCPILRVITTLKTDNLSSTTVTLFSAGVELISVSPFPAQPATHSILTNGDSSNQFVGKLT